MNFNWFSVGWLEVTERYKSGLCVMCCLTLGDNCLLLAVGMSLGIECVNGLLWTL